MEDHPASQDAVAAVAERIWGIHAFRPLQRQAIDSVIAGRDSLVVMPTGGGKSLCYQLPPLITGSLTVVISPLIALMDDQVAGLRLNGYPAAALHSMADAEETARVLDALGRGELRLLLVAPERAMQPGFLARLERCRPGAIAIDEAHCISQWGHDFRPEYRALRGLRERFPEVSVHAYTATATPRVREDIIDQLALRNPEVLVGTFDRPNLTYRVVPRVKPADQIAAILAERHAGSAAIVYCMSRRETESIAEDLRRRGVSCAAYHAGLPGETRARVQERFLTERLDVVVATVAFGMGIDRTDVRCVIHATMPKSVEAYQQETGRAGRDGLDAECVLLYSSADAARWCRLIESSARESGLGEESTRPQLELVGQIRRLVSGSRCRHRALSEHFGQAYGRENCGACDVCLGEVLPIEGSTVLAQKIISCVARLGEATGNAYGAGHIADILRGRRTTKITDRGHDRLSTFGLLASMRREIIISCIDQLIDAGYLERAEGEFPLIRLTRASAEVLRGEREVVLLAPPRAVRQPRASAVDGLTDDDRVVFERLRQVRRRIASEMGKPPYVVFNDATLIEMACVRPSSTADLLEIKGVGRQKVERFGEAFLEAIAAELTA